MTNHCPMQAVALPGARLVERWPLVNQVDSRSQSWKRMEKSWRRREKSWRRREKSWRRREKIGGGGEKVGGGGKKGQIDNSLSFEYRLPIGAYIMREN